MATMEGNRAWLDVVMHREEQSNIENPVNDAAEEEEVIPQADEAEMAETDAGEGSARMQPQAKDSNLPPGLQFPSLIPDGPLKDLLSSAMPEDNWPEWLDLNEEDSSWPKEDIGELAGSPRVQKSVICMIRDICNVQRHHKMPRGPVRTSLESSLLVRLPEYFSSYGTILRKSVLYAWRGDPRLFQEWAWQYLLGEHVTNPPTTCGLHSSEESQEENIVVPGLQNPSLIPEGPLKDLLSNITRGQLLPEHLYLPDDEPWPMDQERGTEAGRNPVPRPILDIVRNICAVRRARPTNLPVRSRQLNSLYYKDPDTFDPLGRLRQESPLYRWRSDPRLLTASTWRYLLLPASKGSGKAFNPIPPTSPVGPTSRCDKNTILN